MLVRQGVNNLHIWDFDEVEEHNIANQIYTQKDIGKKKTTALRSILEDINPEVSVNTHGKWEEHNVLQGDIFLGLDNIDTRRALIQSNMHNKMIKLIFDQRMLLTSCQHYAADWSSLEDRERLLASMQFSHKEAVKNTPVSACGHTLSISPNVRLAAQMAIINFTNFLNDKELSKIVIADTYDLAILKVK